MDDSKLAIIIGVTTSLTAALWLLLLWSCRIDDGGGYELVNRRLFYLD